MRTVGIDLSVDPRKTAVATVSWARRAARVEELALEVDDDALLGAVGEARWCGIDSPLGWPRGMARAVFAHSRGEAWPDLGKDEFRHRRTDRAVVDRLGLHPLSVAADRIALPAWRIAGIRQRLAGDGSPGFDLAGDDGVFEVYPAAALVKWQLPRSGYKQPGAEGRRRREVLVGAIGELAPWLDWGECRAACVDSDHSLDAVVAALITRAAARRRTYPPSEDEREAAHVEGWIHVPRVSLTALAG